LAISQTGKSIIFSLTLTGVLSYLSIYNFKLYEAGNDVMQQVIEQNYNQIKEDVKQIVLIELE
jgi:hypothetical protein